MQDAYIRLDLLRMYPEKTLEEIRELYDWVTEKAVVEDNEPF